MLSELNLRGMLLLLLVLVPMRAYSLLLFFMSNTNMIIMPRPRDAR
jgi:hypothetical protein